jgi:hypothetical protein
VIAGVTVAAYLVPQVMAYAEVASPAGAIRYLVGLSRLSRSAAMEKRMITGTHAIMYTNAADDVRAFFNRRDVGRPGSSTCIVLSVGQDPPHASCSAGYGDAGARAGLDGCGAGLRLIDRDYG